MSNFSLEQANGLEKKTSINKVKTLNHHHQKTNENYEDDDKKSTPTIRRFSMPPMLSLTTSKGMPPNNRSTNTKSLFQKNRILFQIDATKINKKLQLKHQNPINKPIAAIKNKNLEEEIEEIEDPNNDEEEIEEEEENKLRQKQRLKLLQYEQHIHNSFFEISDTLKTYETNKQHHQHQKPIIIKLDNRNSNSSSEDGYYSSSSSTLNNPNVTNAPFTANNSNHDSSSVSSSSSSASASPKVLPFDENNEFDNENENENDNIRNQLSKSSLSINNSQSNKSFFSNAMSTLLRRNRLNASFNDLNSTHKLDILETTKTNTSRQNLSEKLKQAQVKFHEFLISSSKKTPSSSTPTSTKPQQPKRSSSTSYFDKFATHVHFNLSKSKTLHSNKRNEKEEVDQEEDEDKKILNTNVRTLISKFECKQTKF